MVHWEHVGKQGVRGAARTRGDLQPFLPCPLQWYPNPQPSSCAETHPFLNDQQMLLWLWHGTWGRASWSLGALWGALKGTAGGSFEPSFGIQVLSMLLG